MGQLGSSQKIPPIYGEDTINRGDFLIYHCFRDQTAR